jgi:hypothetical protein
MCKKCGATRGRHQAVTYHCPTATGFHPRERFELDVSGLASDADALARLKGKPLDYIEREVARRVLKNVGAVVSCFDLNRTLTKEELVDALALVRNGYQL